MISVKCNQEIEEFVIQQKLNEIAKQNVWFRYEKLMGVIKSAADESRERGWYPCFENDHQLIPKSHPLYEREFCIEGEVFKVTDIFWDDNELDHVSGKKCVVFTTNRLELCFDSEFYRVRYVNKHSQTRILVIP